MKEEFLHYVWKHRSFDQLDLYTTAGDPVAIKKTGYHNDDAGPDFLEAGIRIGEVYWSGSVEIHSKSSFWYQHNHGEDPNYQNVILHVVWEHDREVFHADGHSIPCLILKDLVNPELLDKYVELSNQITDMPCQYSIHLVAPLIRQSMLEKAAVLRLKTKAEVVLNVFKSCQEDWEETCYRLLMAAFGMKVNKLPMQRLAELTPYKLLKKYTNQPDKIAALIFGQAGLIGKDKDAYPNLLMDHFQYLKHKHQLDTSLHRPIWKFSRMRPANFPTLRIAQISAFLTHNPTLFHRITTAVSISEVEERFNIATHPYWEKHYDFGKERTKQMGTSLGKQMKDHLIINVFAPVLMSASHYFDQIEYMERAMTLLEEIPSESNKITRKLSQIGINTKNALESQGALALYYQYCLPKQCLHCNIGGAILRQ